MKTIPQIIKDLEDQSVSGASTVAQHLTDVQDGLEEKGAALRAYLAAEAREIAGWAEYAAREIEAETPAALLCPKCAEKMAPSGSVYYERGEWLGKHFEEEGSAAAHKCGKCGFEIAVVNMGENAA